MIERDQLRMKLSKIDRTVSQNRRNSFFFSISVRNDFFFFFNRTSRRTLSHKGNGYKDLQGRMKLNQRESTFE